VRSAPLCKLVLAIAFVSTMAAHARTTAKLIPRTLTRGHEGNYSIVGILRGARYSESGSGKDLKRE